MSDRANDRPGGQPIRLFVALDIPEAVRLPVAEAAAEFRRLCGSAKWVNLAGAHVTLKFIGWVAPDQPEKIRNALAALPATPPFDLRFPGLGFFPSERRPRVFWAGIDGGAELPRLAALIESALLPLGIPKESREFHPHLTLARFSEPRRAREPRPGDSAGGKGELDATRQLAAAVAERVSSGAADFGSARVDAFHLYQSVLKREGAEYTRLSSFPLAGDKT